MKSVCALTFVLAATAAHAETWQCRDFINSGPVLVTAITATADQPSTGRIAVAGSEFSTYYYLDGFDRRWDFGDAKDGHFPFSFVISPNGNGRYFDFRGSSDGSAKADQVYSCKISKK